MSKVNSGAEEIVDRTRLSLSFVAICLVILLFSTGPYWAPIFATSVLGVTAEPTPTTLSCEWVRAPGRQNDADLCSMPDGAKCLFSRSGQPTVCYTTQGATDAK